MWGLGYSLASPPGAPQQQLPPSLQPLCGLGWPEPCSLDPWPLGGSRSPHPGPLLPQAAATQTTGPLQARPAESPAGSLVQLPWGGRRVQHPLRVTNLPKERVTPEAQRTHGRRDAWTSFILLEPSDGSL